MSRTRWTQVIALVSLTAALGCASAPQASTPSDNGGGSPPASSRSPIYSQAQAGRGREVYMGTCTGCHTIASHTGPSFWNDWVGRPVSDLYTYIKETMPRTDPNSLSPGEYADIVAFMLSVNGMPAGRTELPADTTTLKKIRIDSVPKAPSR